MMMMREFLSNFPPYYKFSLNFDLISTICIITGLNYMTSMKYVNMQSRMLTGTDIVGDVRIPAAYCGIFGYRPSHGAVSSIGVLSNCQSLETVGIAISYIWMPTFFIYFVSFLSFFSPDYYPIFLIFFHLTGWFARDPPVLRQVGNVLLQASSTEPRRTRRLIFADDCFQFYKVPKQKTVNVITKAAESLSGCKATATIFQRMVVFSGMRTYFRKKILMF